MSMSSNGKINNFFNRERVQNAINDEDIDNLYWMIELGSDNLDDYDTWRVYKILINSNIPEITKQLKKYYFLHSLELIETKLSHNMGMIAAVNTVNNDKKEYIKCLSIRDDNNNVVKAYINVENEHYYVTIDEIQFKIEGNGWNEFLDFP